MSSKKKVATTFVDSELTWLEARLSEIKSYIDENPYHLISDRIVSLTTHLGLSEKVAATVEVQQKACREALKEYTQLLIEVNRLREVQSKETIVRGGVKANSRMAKLMNNGS